ncbi:PD-(D/E)XK nuclease superfamily protein [Methyloversatilis sp. RAC08]|uniref:PD-(D/E)XK nuclease family protein n=1 Tax=Methyloversatilis sp. RAC08 TaxID=1842540 RepID=UPI00083D9411|nr:PD-(D/E)XK nuclease family protein [Methyloversatilis sp. RAC08]AOF81280.1 PD-(D/E)XK nuclease superfamily protein [Methyloversatilis sp. RAC08]
MSTAGFETLCLPADAALFARLARLLIDRHGDALADCDLLLPVMAHAPVLRGALLAEAGHALFMPRMLTPALLAARWQGDAPVDPHPRRLLHLVAQLRQQTWLGDVDPWSAAQELLELADALAALPAPPDENALQQGFERAHGLADSAALSLEARLVHAVWHSDCTGTPGHARAVTQALMRAAGAARRPLIHLSARVEPAPAWLELHAARVPVLNVLATRALTDTPVARVLHAAWPPVSPPVLTHAPSRDDALELAGRVRLVGAQSLEQEAQCAASCIAGWLSEGRRNIALVALDREAARRTRALLERRQVLLADETGWKLSTTRAAATVDALLQCFASDGYHRDLLDLLHSPHVAGSLDRDDHAQAIAAIDDWVVRRNHVDGLHALLTDAGREFAGCPAGRLIDALSRAFALMPTHNAPASFRVERLLAALDALGARAALAQDAAGAQVVNLLEQLRADSSGVALDLSFADWRKWLNSEFEQALFRDSAIDSPVVLTPLAATRLRRFDAVYVIGADSRHLAPVRLRGVLGHEGLRRELGLPDSQVAAGQLRDDLAGLIACSDQTVFSWQTQRNGEANLPGVDLQRLDLVLQRAGLPSAICSAPSLADPPPLPELVVSSAPVLDPARVPSRLTASGLADLMACPYRYYARHVLGLGAGDEVEDAMGKGSVGELVHRVLHDFHVAHPRLADAAPPALADALRAQIAAAFDGAIARNFQEHAWADRLHDRADAYIAWAVQRESDGWLFDSGEARRAHVLELPDGAALSLEGRIDRIDRNAEGDVALLDYKLRSAERVRKTLQADDVQLAFYTVLEGGAVSEAAYLALEEDVPVAFIQDDPPAAAQALLSLVSELFPALRNGASLPAHGDEAACLHCDMRGLCRKDWLA